MLHESGSSDSENTPTDGWTQIQTGPCADLFYNHPDPNIDLCAMPIEPTCDFARKQGYHIYYRSFMPNMVPTQASVEALSAVEEIIMIGYPTGLWDQKHNLPIFRRGITASHPAIDFNGLPDFVIDMACFPGSSGSPVIFYRPPTSQRDAVFGLLGILHSGPTYRVKGSIEVIDIPTVATPISVTKMMIHLGYVVKAHQLVGIQEAIREDIKKAEADHTERIIQIIRLTEPE